MQAKMKALLSLLALASALAAALMGAIFLVTEDWRFQFVAFAALAATAGGVSAWRWLQQVRRKRQLRQGLIGKTAEVRQTIALGQRGDVLADGALWVAIAPAARRELKRGDRVRIVGVEGVLLFVEAVEDEEQKPQRQAALGERSKCLRRL
nr:hypothetical protein HGMM_F12F11C39 [uncultured Gammaproteobacteria bacterium]